MLLRVLCATLYLHGSLEVGGQRRGRGRRGRNACGGGGHRGRDRRRADGRRRLAVGAHGQAHVEQLLVGQRPLGLVTWHGERQRPRPQSTPHATDNKPKGLVGRINP